MTTILVFATVVVGFLSLGGAPAYRFEDVADLATPAAYCLGTIVRVLSVVLVTPEWELIASQVLYGTTGFDVRQPLTPAGGGLAAFYLLVAAVSMRADTAAKLDSETE